ncbi:MAG: phosphodiesterase [Clostridia bacterium]|nr:phosphodiesterase [Clostridia bacterium]
MKWMIASDIHGSAFYCRKLLEAFEKEKTDRLLLLGDILYHGPRNPFPKEYAPQEVAAMLNACKENILCVRGNCDSDVDQMVLEFPIMAEYALLSFGKRLIFATHGHKFNNDALPPFNKGDILLHGHTHVSVLEEHENYVYMNPGSVSLPKDGTPNSYMTLCGGTFEWKDIDGKTYRSYTL